MKKMMMLLSVVLMSAVSAQAAVNVPSCWAGDVKNVEDGAYRVTVSTKGLSARAYAAILSSTLNSDALINYQGDGSDLSFDTIEMDFQAETAQQWADLAAGRANAPSFEVIKQDVLVYLNKLSQMKGVSKIECAPVVQIIHHGSASFSN